MSIYETVKDNVSLREVAQRYGIDVNRYSKALCPFHNDRHPSLYVADDHYYCFACGAHGDVIDFAGRLFQLSPYDAARKLMADFHLSPDKPPSAAALHAKHIRTEAQQLMRIPSKGEIVRTDTAHKGEIVILPSDSLRLNDILGDKTQLPREMWSDAPLPMLRTTIAPKTAAQRERLLDALTPVSYTHLPLPQAVL